jgi:hypothetical protein
MNNATEYVIPTGAARHEPRSGGICPNTQTVWDRQRDIAADLSPEGLSPRVAHLSREALSPPAAHDAADSSTSLRSARNDGKKQRRNDGKGATLGMTGEATPE